MTLAFTLYEAKSMCTHWEITKTDPIARNGGKTIANILFPTKRFLLQRPVPQAGLGALTHKASVTYQSFVHRNTKSYGVPSGKPLVHWTLLDATAFQYFHLSVKLVTSPGAELKYLKVGINAFSSLFSSLLPYHKQREFCIIIIYVTFISAHKTILPYLQNLPQSSGIFCRS